jgi:hypothetical protein
VWCHRDARAGHCSAPSKTLGSAVAGNVPPTSAGHLGRRSQVGRRSSRKGCRARVSREEKGRCGPGAEETSGAESGSGGWRVGAHRRPAGRTAGLTDGRAVSSLPPHPPSASCGGRGRHVVVGLRRRRQPSGRDRLRNRFAAGGLTTSRWRRRRRPRRRRAGSPGARWARAEEAPSRAVTCGRRSGAARWVKPRRPGAAGRRAGAGGHPKRLRGPG